MPGQKRGFRLWERISLRNKLTALSVAIIGVLLLASSAGTLTLLKTYLIRNTDTILSSTVSALIHEDPSTLSLRLTSGQLHLPSLPSDYYIAYLDPTGQIIITLVSAATPQNALPDLSSFTAKAVHQTHGMPFDFVSSNTQTHSSKTWRLLAVKVEGKTDSSLIVGLPTSATDALLDQYSTIGFFIGALLLLLSAISTWFTITSALKPLREVERTAEAVAAGDISKRLVDRVGKTEISRINHSLNTMLNSIEGALSARNKTLEQMRRFVADASHELRTPLVSVRGYAELYRMGALQKPADIAEAMGRIESEAIRMGDLVENLLALARLDDAKPTELRELDLIALGRSVAKDAAVADGGHEIVLLDLLGVPLMPKAQLLVKGDPNQLRQVLTNLLANAMRFSPKGAKVELRIGNPLGSHEHIARIEVVDRGEGIPPELREKVFERFFRADNSRNRETGGSGLGLAIVKSIVDRHGASIVADETPGGGATFRVDMPVLSAEAKQ